MSKQYESRDYWRGMLNASVCKLLILRAVCERPGHGYEIIRRVAALTHDACAPTEGTVYPVLREFEVCGCLSVHDDTVRGRTRHVYCATPQGRAALRAGLAVWRHGLAKMSHSLADTP
ncbi:MAG: PadR family transcriptional regulator [Verrucomicrobia bacterium]|nr:PadR family transcriptional regulator [Verrucomicrobiota bacterium]MBU1734913.1 PadR family transcriptional regulator [Verrucomicrobiota bacterium]MBU1857707.1 PadR family transcriptional regulator [Verrucomicrobiota bacterium]